MISSLQSFYAAGMDNISKVALEKLVTLGQSCCLEINFFAQFMQNFSMPGQLIDKWFYRIFNPWRRVERRLGRVGISHNEQNIPRSKYIDLWEGATAIINSSFSVFSYIKQAYFKFLSSISLF